MKVKVSFTVEVDQRLWADEFGLDINEVRADVQQYVARIGQEFVTDQLGLGMKK